MGFFELLKKNEVLVGIYRLMKQGKFPQQIKIAERYPKKFSDLFILHTLG
jgi:hypothetical protein